MTIVPTSRLWWLTLLVALFLSSPSLVSVDAVGGVLNMGIVGQYRWFTSMLAPKRRKNLEKKDLSLYDERAYGEWSDDLKEEFTIPLADFMEQLGDESQQMVALTQMAQRVTSTFETYVDKEENSLIGLGPKLCTVELLCWPFGRDVYVLKNAKERITVDKESPDTIEVEFWTPRLDNSDRSSSSRGIPLAKSIRLKTQLVLDDGQIKVTVFTSSNGLSRSVVGRILRSAAHFWQERLFRELAVVLSRREQLQALSAASKIASKQRKAKEIDRIAHPEKYKQQSPSVRKLDGAGGGGKKGGGSGRYTPSAATQARRTVKSG